MRAKLLVWVWIALPVEVSRTITWISRNRSIKDTVTLVRMVSGILSLSLKLILAIPGLSRQTAQSQSAQPPLTALATSDSAPTASVCVGPGGPGHDAAK